MDSYGGYITWSGVASCGVSVMLYLLSRHESVRLRHLQNAVSLPTLGDVEELDSESLPMIVAVRGRATTADPIISELTSTRSVIAELMEELSSKTQNERGEWSSDTQVVKQQRWEAAWFLTDGSETRVDVSGTLHADLLQETYQIAKEFKSGQRTVYNQIIDRLTGYQPLGVRRTERILPVDTPLTVVGELDHSVTDLGDSRYVIGRPNCGTPFYITDRDIEELRDSVRKVVRSHTWLAVGFGAVGFALLGTRTWKQVKSAMRYRQIRKQLEKDVRLRARDVAQTEAKPVSPLLEEARKPSQCIVCWDRPADAAFIPCGHNCVCRRCGLELNRCPVCRKHCSVYRIYPL